MKDGTWVAQKKKVAEEIQSLRKMYGRTWPPDNWDLVSTPAHYLNVSGAREGGILNFAPDTSVQIGSESVVLELAGVNAPKLFSVVWPHTAIYPAENAAPTPFLLFIRQGMGKVARATDTMNKGYSSFSKTFCHSRLAAPHFSRIRITSTTLYPYSTAFTTRQS